LAGAEAQPVILLDGLSVDLGGRRVLHDLRAELSGRAIGLLGPNGAGKTTLLHTLLGFYPPAGGTARVMGLDIGAENRQLRHLVGYMPENEAYIPRLSAVRFVRLMGELSGLPPASALERTHEVLFYVGLGEARYRTLGTYSVGMRQMVKLAQALVHGPKLLLLDEPTNGLDPPARQRMLNLIRDIRDSGEVQLIVSSHLLRDVEAVCSDVVVLNEGRIAVTCDLEAERRANRRFLQLEIAGDAAAFASALSGLGCEMAQPGAGRLKAVLPEGVEVRDVYAVADQLGVQIQRLDYRRDSLEDIFLRALEDSNGRA
jgi:ABC-2 type transport system ATP-binding protein